MILTVLSLFLCVSTYTAAVTALADVDCVTHDIVSPPRIIVVPADTIAVLNYTSPCETNLVVFLEETTLDPKSACPGGNDSSAVNMCFDDTRCKEDSNADDRYVVWSLWITPEEVANMTGKSLECSFECVLSYMPRRTLRRYSSSTKLIVQEDAYLPPITANATQHTPSNTTTKCSQSSSTAAITTDWDSPSSSVPTPTPCSCSSEPSSTSSEPSATSSEPSATSREPSATPVQTSGNTATKLHGLPFVVLCFVIVTLYVALL